MAFLCCGVGPYAKTFELTTQGLALHHTMDSLNADVTCVRYNHNGAGAFSMALGRGELTWWLCEGRILASCSTDGGICLDVAVSGELLSRFFYPATSIAERVRRCLCRLLWLWAPTDMTLASEWRSLQQRISIPGVCRSRRLRSCTHKTLLE